MIKPVTIGRHQVGPGHSPFVIAEACINHFGKISIAKQMVYHAHAQGAHCIKFQYHVLENEMLRDAPQSDNFDEPLYDTLDRTNLTLAEHIELKQLCDQLGIMYLCTPFSRDAADILDEKVGVAAFKVGSGEMTNIPLIEHIARKGKPMIVSTGMCVFDEVAETVAAVKKIGTPLVLTHCVSAYPCPYEIVNLGVMKKYETAFEVPVGLSDHSRGIYTAIGATALGAACLEKHFTLDKLGGGPDNVVSLEPFELGELVKGADAVFKALGSERKIFKEEEQIVAWARESVVSERAIAKGTTITEEMVWVKRPSPGPGVVPAKDLDKVVGKRAKADIPKDTQIRWELLES